MVLVLDIGNSNIVMGLMDDNKLFASKRIDTNLNRTADEYATEINEFLYESRVLKSDISGAAMSSVVPLLTQVQKYAIKKALNIEPFIINTSMDTGLKILVDNPNELGNDLLCGAVAGIDNYNLPLIIFDIGTATTVSVINDRKEFIGGLIYPGPKVSLETLSLKAAQLPNVAMEPPGDIIGKNTRDCMLSGIVYGNAFMIDGIINNIEKKLQSKSTVIATGGICELIIPYCERKIICDDNLMFKGIMSIYKRVGLK